ncbi:MAG: hypothetical protein ACD_5C00308G0002 [uncultured bacterium]|nr:MAG: hypothetical protein ACD_5C00308G0002 [uncultured bacterium]
MFFILRSFGISPKGKPRTTERPSQQATLTITSSAFDDYGMIPTRYTCEGENVSPPLEITNIPEEARSLALIMHDSDAPVPGGWTHWILFNIKVGAKVTIQERRIPEGAIEGFTSFGAQGYGGPCPLSGTHHYEFRLYALDSELSLSGNAKKHDLEHAMEGHVLAVSVLIGLYKKKDS